MIMNWVKCSDRLPNDCEDVLIYCPINKKIVAASLFYDANKPLFFCIIDFDENDHIAALYEITHWMPLPHKPEES